MAKPKTPLFSLEAHGTIGDTLTFQGKGNLKVSRSKPLVPFSLSLPQQYQRWLYEDYVALWHLQTNAVKATYRGYGTRHHLTGFAYWMKYHLLNLPNIAGWWKLDEPGGAKASDSSRTPHDGTITGASPIAGKISGAYHFDGINDVISVGDTSKTCYALEFFLRPTDPITLATAAFRMVRMREGKALMAGDFTGALTDETIGLVDGITPGVKRTGIKDNISADWHHLALNWNATLSRYDFYLDGTQRTVFSSVGGHVPLMEAADFRLSPQAVFYPGDFDNVILYSASQEPILFEMHSARGYPH